MSRSLNTKYSLVRVVWLALIVSCGAGRYTHAAETGAAESGVAACRAIKDGAARLACYDKLPITERAAPEAVSPKAPPRQPVPAPAATANKDFGAEALPKSNAGAEESQTLSSRVVGRVTDLHKGQVLSLENGQRWLCIDDRHYGDYDQTNPVVKIERNFFGTYWMRLAGADFTVKVRRIQ